MRDPRAAAVLRRYHERFGGSLELPVSVGVGDGRALEREANVFAAELLMPEPAVRVVWAELGDPAASAACFEVSPTAMQWRLFSFDLVDRKPER